MKSILTKGFVAIFLLVVFGISNAHALATVRRMRCQVSVGQVQIQVKYTSTEALTVWVTTTGINGITKTSPKQMEVLSSFGTVSVDWNTFPDLAASGVLTIPGDFVADGDIITTHAKYVEGALIGEPVFNDPAKEMDTSGIFGSYRAVCATKVSGQFTQQTKPNPDISVTISDLDGLNSFDPTLVDASGSLPIFPWGSVTIQTSPSRKVTVKNIGLKPLEILSINQGMNPLFNISQTLNNSCSPPPGNTNPVRLDIEAMCSFTILFSPLVVDDVPQSTTFFINSNDPDTPSLPIKMNGSGSPVPAPKIGITGPAGQSGDVSFGNVFERDRNTIELSINNIGNAPLTIINISAPPTPYSILNDSDTCSGTTLGVLPNQASCTFSVTFNPSFAQTAPFTAALSIESDDPNNPNVTMNLMGNGVLRPVPEIKISDTNLDAFDGHIAFGSVTAGNFREETVTISNIGTFGSELVIDQIGGTKPISDPFSLVSDLCSPQTILLKDESCAFVVRFAPMDLFVNTNVNDTIDILSNDLNSPMTFTVEGTGLRSGGNHIPDSSVLVFPPNGQIDLGSDVQFGWNFALDPDSDSVSYTMVICENQSMLNCSLDPFDVTPSLIGKASENTSFVGMGLGVGMLFGLALIGSIGGRKKTGMFFAVMFVMGALLVSCTSGGGGSTSAGERSLIDQSPPPMVVEGLPAMESPLVSDTSVEVFGLAQEKTYFWKIITNDAFGGKTESETWHFTT